jgi:hypothetical protein
MALISVFITVWLGNIFAPLGAPAASFPYVLTGIVCLLGKNALVGLRWVDPLLWGVPETVKKALKDEDAKAAASADAE